MQYAGRKPYGDIYSVPTSAIDALSARLYAEHQKQQQQQALELKGLDDMFMRNVSQIRDEDVPDFSNAYEQYKLSKIGLMKGGLKGKDRIAAEMDAQRKLAETWKILNDSKQAKSALSDITKRIGSKPDDHFEIAPTMVANTNGVPTKAFALLTRPDPDGTIDEKTGQIKMMPYNPLDYNNYVDRGNVKSWQEPIKKAVGQLSERNVLSEDIKDQDGSVLGKNVTPIKATESPANYYNSLASAMSGTGRSRHFSNTFKGAYGEEEAQRIIDAYNDNVENNPLWKQAWGEEGIKISPEALLSPATRTLALNTMAYALTHQPQVGTPRKVMDDVAMLNKKRKEGMEDWKNKEKIRQANRMELFNMKEAAKNAGEDADDLWYDSYLNKISEDAKNLGERQVYTYQDGRKMSGYKVPLDPLLNKSIGFDEKNKGYLLLTDDGKFVPVFYKTDENYEPIKKNGAYIVEPTRTNVLSQDAMKLALGGKTGVKQLNKEMGKPSKQQKVTVKKGDLDDL